jgi:hypothetical protein
MQYNTFIDEMAQRTKEDIIDSGKYSYKSFIAMVDDVISRNLANQLFLEKKFPPPSIEGFISYTPIHAPPPFFSGNTRLFYKFTYKIIRWGWNRLPESIKIMIKRGVGRA